MKRRHIPLKSKLAAALACLLPQADRDYYRRHNTPADEILKLFEWDHIALCALGGSDLWWNLDPKSKAEHREKSRRDTSIVAKVKRIQRKTGVDVEYKAMPEGDGGFIVSPEFSTAVMEKMFRETWGRKWRSRKIKSRPFPMPRRKQA